MEDGALSTGESACGFARMIQHVFKMVWNRKRMNALITIEILFSFVVLFTVLGIIFYTIDNFRKPLGYEYVRVWKIHVEPHNFWDKQNAEKNNLAEMNRIIHALHDLPEISAVGGICFPPYPPGASSRTLQSNGRSVAFLTNAATDELRDALSVELVAGRWFSSEDDAAKIPPAVINERLARDFFGEVDPVGKLIDKPEQRIVGVINDFRNSGPFAPPAGHLFSRISLNDTSIHFGWYDLVIKLRPGTTASFEEPLVKTLGGIAKGWTFEISKLEEDIDGDIQSHQLPLIEEGLVAVFLLIMVALGLVGVMWQNVIQRTMEIGLRRAVGAERKRIVRQIFAEQMVITSIGVFFGTIIVLQAPLLGLFDNIEPGVYAAALACSLVAMYAITFLCGLFPSRVAAEVQPVEALHYE
jgi:putative ABC transport system permease protein